ncbi:MAG: HEAT repeat domain-containing protein [Coleofasciculaceae cyanobacterium SM2_1_6]|nr:HEAT repeat domain-containing protein [Coleofasciculaceae cyanobacterium SM2_1_6]
MGKIDQGNSYAIAALLRILENTENHEGNRAQAAGSLGKIDQGNPHAITELIRILETTENKNIRWEAADNLQKILATPEQYAGVVSALKDCLSNEVYQNNFDLFNKCYKVLWECAANLPYPDFYHAWHSPPE